MGQYSQCISLLNKMSVLPNEGAYEGRAVYRAANLYRAIEQLNLGNYESAMKVWKILKMAGKFRSRKTL